ncbi:hypothetical protein ACQEU3_20055 [Spirillospora sp. CA-253888]
MSVPARPVRWVSAASPRLRCMSAVAVRSSAEPSTAAPRAGEVWAVGAATSASPAADAAAEPANTNGISR